MRISSRPLHRSAALWSALTLLVACGLASLGPARAAEPPASVEAMVQADPALSKASSHLLQARWRAASGLDLEAPIVRGALHIEPLVTERRPLVDVRLKRLDPALLGHLRGLGMEIRTSSIRWARAEGRLDLDLLDEVAALPGVTAIHPWYGAVTRAGSVTSQGVASLGADDVVSTLGQDGSGVTVGLMSDSYHDTLGGSESGGACSCATPGSVCANVVTGMANQGTGDLPAGVPILLDLGGGGSDEGAALGEAVLDVAPGSAQMFRTAFLGEADFATGISGLVNCGADVIVDDAFYFAEPMFQDGPVAQAAQAAVDGGVSYFSAAGNEATFGIDDPFADSATADDEDDPASGDDFHDFDPGAALDRFACVLVPEDCGVRWVLQWSEPWSGVLGAGASSDLDIYLCTAPPSVGTCTKVSGTRQGCGDMIPGPSGDPIEIAIATVSGGPGAVCLAVEHHCGDQGLEFRVATFPFGSGCGFPGGYDFEDGGAGETPIYVDAQIYGHPAAEGVVAVAASFYGEFDSGGTVDPPAGQIDVEPFSSLGGALPFYFDGSGNPLPLAGPVSAGPVSAGPITSDNPPAPRTRFKPEITAPDGGNNTFFGSDIGFDDDPPPGPTGEFPNFFGTSASAPHAAAVAALMQEASGNGLAPLPLKQILRAAALDIEELLLPGLDPLSGEGFLDALRSVNTLDPTPPNPFIDDLEFDLDGGDFVRPGFSGQVKVQANDSITFRNGDFSGGDFLADEMIFADGFESGDTSSWSHSVP